MKKAAKAAPAPKLTAPQGHPGDGSLGFSTRAIHAGQQPDPATGAIVTPVYLTSTYVQEEVGVTKGYDYSRGGNPTRTALEQNLASLEGGHSAYAFGSGMAAITTLLLDFDAGAHVVVSRNVYGGTFRLFERVSRRHGFRFTFVDARDSAAVEAALTPDTRLLFLETPTNPMMELADIRALSRLAHGRGAKVAVDNTFLTPYFQRPLELGADYVVHSATKYIGGHSDVVGGLLVTRTAEDSERIHFLQMSIGAILSPFDSWLLLRGLKTLAVRMREHARNATSIARWLEKHPRVRRVHFPALESHPQHELATRQSTGPGGLLSFELDGGQAEAKRLVESTRVCSLAESLGAVETLISIPSLMTHASVPRPQREALGITDNLVRISVGIEDEADLLADLDQAFAKL
ncbi:MAG: PLP-dependent transferase [Candidatus Wallbacteria bacterium]|nr:PLP-dependent transferase [Candidatus Wallbacteria bacterium]